MTALELKRRATDLRGQILANVKKAESENRELSEDEASVSDEWKAEAEKLERRAKIFEEAEAGYKAANQPEGRQSEPLAGRANGDGVEIAGRIDPGPQQDDKTRSFSDFLYCIAAAKDPRTGGTSHERLTNVYGSRYNSYESSDKRAAMAQASGVTGGYLVPSSMYTQLMSFAAETAVIRPRATKFPMATDEVDIPVLDQTVAPTAGNTNFFGGVQMAWTAEAASIGETEPVFRQTTLKAFELTGYAAVSRTLIANSAISVDAILFDLFGKSIAWYEDMAFINGNGIGKPLGLRNSPAMISTAARAASGTITFADATLVWTRILAESRKNATFLVSQAAEPALLKMTAAANSVFVPVGMFLSSGTNAVAQPVNYMMLGREVVVTEKLPALNTTGDFICADLTKYLIGDRPNSMEIAVSGDYLFRTNQMAYRIVHRVAGMPWASAPVTLQDTSTTVGPFCQLLTV